MTKRNRKRKYATAMHKRRISNRIASGMYNGQGYYLDGKHIKRIDSGSVHSKKKRIASRKLRRNEKSYLYAQDGSSYKKTYSIYD